MFSTLAADWLYLIAILVIGAAAGFINIVAGGGSLLTLPLLIVAGLDESLANGTSRLGILPQNLAAIAYFHRENKLDWWLARQLLPPTLLGAAMGAAAGVTIPDLAFRNILAAVMLLVALWSAFEPRRPVLAGKLPAAPPRRDANSWPVWLVFLAIGFYGGMIQAGVGYLLLAALTLFLGQDLIAANVMKVLLIGAYIPITVAIFLMKGKVDLAVGGLLAIAQSLGAWLGASATLKKGAPVIRITLVVVLVLTALELLGVFRALSRAL